MSDRTGTSSPLTQQHEVEPPKRERRTITAIVVAAVVVMAALASALAAPPASAMAPRFDVTGRQGSVFRLYRAYFLRNPDISGFAYWLGRSASGRSLYSISSDFAASSEFKGRYGPLDNEGFIDLVYRNVLNRHRDDSGFRFWVNRLDSGYSRGATMVSFSDSLEFRAKTATMVPIGYRAGDNAGAMLNKLKVAPEVRTGYDRDLFRHWDDDDGDRCDTRCEVLAAEQRPDGTWWSAWDNKTVPAASGLHIDHVVALAEAWDSGARNWDSARRDRFADWQTNLVAVSASSNMSKSDRDAAEWKPATASGRCVMAELVVTTKYEWSLSVDSAEKAALSSMLNGCSAN